MVNFEHTVSALVPCVLLLSVCGIWLFASDKTHFHIYRLNDLFNSLNLVSLKPAEEFIYFQSWSLLLRSHFSSRFLSTQLCTANQNVFSPTIICMVNKQLILFSIRFQYKMTEVLGQWLWEQRVCHVQSPEVPLCRCGSRDGRNAPVPPEQL